MDERVPYLTIAGGLVVAGVGVAWTLLRLRKKKRRTRRSGVDYPRDVVVVHQEGCGPCGPSLCPFVMKLTTYLRLANIPYQVDARLSNFKAGPKHTIPWIEFNDQIVGDSYFIMKFFNEKFDVDLDRHLDRKQKAHARSLQVWMDEFFNWLVIYTQWVILEDELIEFGKLYMPWLIKHAIRKHVQDTAQKQGIGLHSNEEISLLLCQDLRNLEEILGDQLYFNGDEPTEVDCSVFGQLSQLRWQMPDQCAGKILLIDELPKLAAYCERMKEKVWPDWDECLSRDKIKGKTFCQGRPLP